MTVTQLTTTESLLIRSAVVRMRARIAAVVFGMAGGVGLAAATLWLVIRGGHNVGLHLNLLNNFFPGYEVSWAGSVVGFLYGGAVGAIMGWSLATVYNRLSDLRAA